MLAKTGAFAKRSALLSPDGKFIVLTALMNRAAQVHDASTGALKFKLGDDSTSTPGAALSSDGGLIVTASGDGKARVWDSGTGNLLRTLEGSPGIPLSAASFSPDDKLIVTVSDPRFNVVTVWDAGTGRRLGETLRGHSASFSPDGKSVLTVSSGDVARVSGVSDGRAIAELQGLTGKVTHLAFSDDGLRVMAATSDRKVGVWEAASGRNLARHEYAGDIKTVALNADGRLIATTDSDWAAQVWDTEADKVSEFGKDDSAGGVALSPDGRLLLVTTGSYESEVTKVWDIAAGRKVADLAGRFAAFSGDGKRVLTINDDIARVWDAGTWDSVAELRGHTERINGAAFSPDGKFAVTASDDNTALVWDAANSRYDITGSGYPAPGPEYTHISSGGNMHPGRGTAQGAACCSFATRTARLYACVMCGGLAELLERARERFARHPRPLTPGEQKKFIRQTSSGLAGARSAGLSVP